jgi:hypothetical protein
MVMGDRLRQLGQDKQLAEHRHLELLGFRQLDD